MPEGSHRRGLILGIESSCDETAAAVVRSGTEVLSNVVASQIALHSDFGGVVPELASREHLRNIVPVVRAALRQAGASFAELDAIAVTEGPGLAGALLVGITYAKALSFALSAPLLAVNHLEGHIHAVLMEHAAVFAGGSGPLLALVVSGGHTHLYLAERTPEDSWRYRTVGRTIDDAAGEAFDKVAKLLGLGYPGGPWIDAIAPFGDASAVRFRFAPIGDGRGALESFDLSFSGIKTAVLRYTQAHGMAERIERRRPRTHSLQASQRVVQDLIADGVLEMESVSLLASFQAAVVGNLLRQTFRAAERLGAGGILVSGGVASNAELRRRFRAEADRRGLPIAFPSLALATDNAAMIAAAAWPKLLAGEFAGDGLGATPQLRLGSASPVEAGE